MVDVIVIGAGFAGVTVARELSKAGLSSVILEANERIGGRTYRTQYKGIDFELGGAYVHWMQPHVWAELTRYGLRVEYGGDIDETEVRLFSAGKLHTFDLETGYDLLTEAYGALYAADPQPADVLPFPHDPLTYTDWREYVDISVGEQVESLALPQPQYDLLNAMLAADMSGALGNAALVEVLSMRALLGSDDFDTLSEVTGTYIVEGGTSALLEHMLADSGVQVEMGQRIAQVKQTADGVRVQTADGQSYEARAVVVATPLNTWVNIDFEPALSDAKRTVAQQGHAGSGTKFFILVAGEAPQMLGLAALPHPISILTPYIQTEAGTWLLAFGPTAPTEFTTEWAQAAVELLLPGAQVLDVVAHNWAHDPHALGTWAIYRPGQMAHLEALVAPEGRVVFAGSDIALGWRGYIDGAIESGLRAAREVRTIVKARG